MSLVCKEKFSSFVFFNVPCIYQSFIGDENQHLLVLVVGLP